MCAHRYCICAVHGVYSCRWVEHESISESTTAEKFWWWFLLLVSLLSISWLFFWSVLSNDYADFEWFTYQMLEYLFSWSSLILTVSVICVFYLLMLFFTGVALIVMKQSKHLHLCHKILAILVCIFCIAGYVLLSIAWEDEYYTLIIALKILAPYLHMALLFSVTMASWIIFQEIMQIENDKLRIPSVIGTFILMLVVCLLPVAFKSPCFVNDRNISKPLLIGHRGGEMRTAPENTFMSYSRAISCDVFGVETDVSISLDGIPFLMHDFNLLRTTNVEKIFPNRSEYGADTFTWNELQELDAGSWFLEEDPFGTVRFLTESEKDEVRKQKIPSLENFSQAVGNNNYSIIFDLREPQYGHPYRYNFIDLTMQTMLKSGIKPNEVLWLPKIDRAYVHNQVPGFRIVSHENTVQYALNNNITVLNLQYNFLSSEEVHSYLRNNLSVIQYVISSPWLFSVAWCQGSTYVTTNNCERLKDMRSPIWTLSATEYLSVWICCDIIAFSIFVCIFFIQYRRFNVSESNQELRNSLL